MGIAAKRHLPASYFGQQGETLYPGHGEPGPAQELIARQIEYREIFRMLAAGGCDPERVAAEMERRYPGYVAAISDLLHQGAQAPASEVADE